MLRVIHFLAHIEAVRPCKFCTAQPLIDMDNPATLAAVAATAEDADNFSITYHEARLKFIDTTLTVPGATVLSFRVGGQSRRTSM